MIKGGGKGYCFEQIIVNNLSPSTTHYNLSFRDLIIQEKKIIPEFVPKINQVNISFLDEKIKLEKNKTYLIEQEIFGGKAIDFIIIDSRENDQAIFAFQASILKETLFNEDDIKDILTKMNLHLQNYFTNLKVKKENLFFGYVFSFINEKKKEFKTMIKTCDNNKLPYSYYDYKQKIFCKQKNNPIHSIYEIVDNPFCENPNFSFHNSDITMRRHFSVNNLPRYEMSHDIKEKVINLLSKIFQKEIQDLDFHECLNKRYAYRLKYDFYFTKDFDNKNSFVIIKRDFNYSIYNLEEKDNQAISEYLFNNDCLFDCYFIHFKGEKKKEPIYDGRKRELTEDEQDNPKEEFSDEKIQLI